MSRDKTDSTFSFNLSIRKEAKTVSEVPQGAVPQVTKGPAKDETEGKKAEGPPPEEPPVEEAKESPPVESAKFRLRRSGVPLLPRWGSVSFCSLTSRALVGSSD